jgi:hypothetical protein
MTVPHLPRLSSSSAEYTDDEKASSTRPGTTAANTPFNLTPRNIEVAMPTPLCEKGVLSAAKERNEEYTEMESGLRGGVQLRGTISHRSRRDVMGVLERVEKVDMGDGLGEREVIVIDWTPNDPGVGLLLAGCAWLMPRTHSIGLNLANTSSSG